MSKTHKTKYGGMFVSKFKMAAIFFVNLLYVITECCTTCMCISDMRWPSGLELWTGDRVVQGSNLSAATSFRNFGNSIYPALPVSFGGYTNIRRSLLSGIYARGSKKIPPVCTGNV